MMRFTLAVVQVERAVHKAHKMCLAVVFLVVETLWGFLFAIVSINCE
jgi:hypothetical protein